MNGLALALVLLLAGPQNTDPTTDEARIGSRLDPAARVATNTDKGNHDATMFRFVQCAVSRREARMRGIVDARTEPEYQSALGGLSDVQRCAIGAYVDQSTTSINFGSDRGTLRGFVAEAFLAKDRGRAAALAPLPLQRVYLRDWYAMTGRVRQVDEMAVCVADTNPAGILAVLDTGIGTKDQRQAIVALAPSLGPCLSTGFKLSANALGMRTALAEALYHRTYDAPQPATEGTPK